MAGIQIPTRAAPVGGVGLDAANTPFFNVRARKVTTPGEQALLAAAEVAGEQALKARKDRDDATLLEIEKRITDKEKSMIDPATGLMTRQLGEAAGITDQVSELFKDEEFEDLLEDLPSAHRSAAIRTIRGAEFRAYTGAARHEAAQMKAHKKVQTSAVLDGLTEVVLANPTDEAGIRRLLLKGDQYVEDYELEGIDPGSPAGLLAIQQQREKTLKPLFAAIELKHGASAAEEAIRTYGPLISRQAENALLAQVENEARVDRAKTTARRIMASQPVTVGDNWSMTATIDQKIDAIEPALTFFESENKEGPGVINVNPDGTVDTGKYQINSDTRKVPPFPGMTPHPYPDGFPADMKVSEMTRIDREFARDYLRHGLKRYNGDIEATLISYNAGPKWADLFVSNGRDWTGLPERTQRITKPYTEKIMKRMGVRQASTMVDGNAMTHGQAQEFVRRSIKDPEEQEMVIEQLNAMMGAQQRMEQIAQGKAVKTAVIEMDRMIEDPALQGTMTFEQAMGRAFPPGTNIREALGTQYAQVRQMFDTIVAGGSVTTDTNTYMKLIDFAHRDPAAFLKSAQDGFPEDVHKLSREDRRHLQEKAYQLNAITKKGKTLTSLIPKFSELRTQVPMEILGLSKGNSWHKKRYAAAQRFAMDYLTGQVFDKLASNQRTESFTSAELLDAMELGLNTAVSIDTAEGIFDTSDFNNLGLADALQQLDDDGATAAHLAQAAEAGTLEIGGISFEGDDAAAGLRWLADFYEGLTGDPAVSARELVEFIIQQEEVAGAFAQGAEGIAQLQEQFTAELRERQRKDREAGSGSEEAGGGEATP